MKNIKAFPFPDPSPENRTSGMDLRDYFAAKAMQGLCSYNTAGEWRIIAEISYLIADAMLKEREK